jgi:hypothetical protein
MAMKPFEVLREARTLLARREGWIQGRWVAPRELGGSAYCIHGAIDAAGMASDASFEALQRVAEVLGVPVTVFNDLPSTTQDDVLEAVDLAIEAERNGEPIRRIGAPAPMTDLETLTMFLNSEPVPGPDAIVIPFPDRRGGREVLLSMN